jgi:hypothetical protein
MTRLLKYRMLTSEHRARMLSLWYVGLDVKSIAQRFSLHPATVARVLREAGIEIPKGHRLRRV